MCRELQCQGKRVVLCEKEKQLLSGNRADATNTSSHLESCLAHTILNWQNVEVVRHLLKKKKNYLMF